MASVPPWSPRRAETNSDRPVTARAIRSATSLASEPVTAKFTRPNPSGRVAHSRSASSMIRVFAYQDEWCTKRRPCSTSASVSSGWQCPSGSDIIPDVPSR
jgi:hypothetical protein